jgi:hypothetical protein
MRESAVGMFDVPGGKAETPGRRRLLGSRSHAPKPGPSTGTLGSARLAARATIAGDHGLVCAIAGSSFAWN